VTGEQKAVLGSRAFMSSEYERRGVSATKEDVHQALVGTHPGLFPGAFCKVVPDIAGDQAMVSIMHADGAGTKSALAYIHFRETGDARIFQDLAQDSIVMNIDDLICVGAVDNFVVSNTIGRNAQRIGGQVVAAVIQGYESFAARLRGLGIAITLAGGETADLGDLVRTIIVDSTVFARMERARVVDCTGIRPGDVIIGLASFGRCRYEDAETSGIGSNGLTLARHVLLHPRHRTLYPETYAETMDTSSVYAGTFSLGDRLPGSSQTVGWGLLSPTRTYAPVIKAILGARAGAIGGIVHCSGGGQAKCRRFGRGLHYIKDALFAPPAIFSCLEDAGVPPVDLYQVFNMGHRMELYCRAEVAGDVISIAEQFDVPAKVVGRIEQGPGSENLVTVWDRGRELRYGTSAA
jgi:phosphoribosylformylglycinamidine cyclo-ligase